MVASLKASTYLVDGVDLEVTGVALTHEGSGLWSGLTESIGVSQFPGVDGGHIDGGTFKPYTYSTMFQITASGFDAVWASIRSLRRRCKPGQSVTLTRQMPDPEGGSSNINHTTTARRQSDRIAWLGPSAAQVDIDWLIADAPWYAAAVAISSAAGTTTVLGDLPTHRMTITLPAGAARTIENTTTEHSLTFGATVPTGGVLIDVEAQAATAITGGADLSASLSWTKAYPMRLNAGSNTLTISAGTASISYQPAYQ